jgi:hypothetical protein
MFSRFHADKAILDRSVKHAPEGIRPFVAPSCAPAFSEESAQLKAMLSGKS